MKREPYNNLRFSEKIRQSECFIQADGLQKKIRKFNAGKGETVDAEVKMREIECFWKEGWEYNHTHHIYLEPKVTRPRFYLPHSQQVKPTHPYLNLYYQTLRNYLRRMKIDNEDQTNYKIEQRELIWEERMDQTMEKSEMKAQLQVLISFKKIINDIGITKAAFEHLLSTFRQISEQMMVHFRKSMELSQEDMMNESLQEEQIAHLEPISSACARLKDSKDQTCLQTQRFMQLITEVLEEAKESKQYSTVLAVQPRMEELASILHPLCWGLYSTFSKELLVKVAKRERGRRYADECDQKLSLNGDLLQKLMSGIKLLEIKDDLRVQEEKHSKVVVLNLDGYESEFNLEWVRNYSQNVMYVSFPKFQNGVQMEHYRHRFYKKVMYNFTRSELGILGSFEKEHQDINLTLQREDLFTNPEKYHETIDQLYPPLPECQPPPDYNKNLFVFPIGLDLHSQQEVSNIDRQAEGYESELVRFILRDQIYSAMKVFRPNIILISYSGKLAIDNLHFLEMMQELIKVCPKVALFPNFTAALSPSRDPAFAHTTRTIVRRIIGEEERERQRQQGGQWLGLLEKLSIFLKVSAGYYSLIRSFEEEELHRRYRNSQAFPLIIYLYGSLKNEFEHCKKRVQSATLQTIKASLEATLQEHSKQIERCVSPYYKRLFAYLHSMLLGNAELGQYEGLVMEVKERFPPTFEEDEPQMRQWQQLQRTEEMRLASAKYHEISHVYIRQKPSKEEYLSIKDQKMKDVENFYRFSFYYKENNHTVKIYNDVTLLWKEDQQAPNSHFHLVLTNLFSPLEDALQHYITKPQVPNKYKIQRCSIIPLAFCDAQGLITLPQFQVWTLWNYAETAHNVLLYWPSQFDFIQHYLAKMLDRNYEPPLQPRVFALKKSTEISGEKEALFYEVNVGAADVVPRWGCSSFNIDDQLYILGGSYGRQKSYMDLQNDVTTLDLTDNSFDDFRPAKLRNLNKELYAGEAFHGKLREGRSVNSFVRPRQEFEFYSREELLIEEQVKGGKEKKEKEKGELQMDDRKKIYMIGGYGEEFKSPYSLFVNSFYQITVQPSTRRLVGIAKKVVVDKAVPINVKEMIKNRGVFQKGNILHEGKTDQDRTCTQKIINNRHYIHHRVVYALKNEQLQFKIKCLIATPLYQHSKKDFQSLGRRTGYLRSEEEEEPQTLIISKVEGCQHQILVEVEDISYLYSLNLEIIREVLQEIPLTNETIIALDTKGSTIYALLSHPSHTHSKCILASETVNRPSQAITHREKHYALSLKEVTVFEQSLNLHSLIICNAQEIALLHGLGFEGCLPQEHLIKMKHKIDIKLQPLCVSPLHYSTITTFFVKKNNIITSINFLQTTDEARSFTINRFTLDVNQFTEGWKAVGQVHRIVFLNGATILQKVGLEARVNKQRDITNIIILLTASKKTYYLKLSQLGIDDSRVEVQELSDQLTAERIRLWNPLPKVVKNEELYADFNYWG